MRGAVLVAEEDQHFVGCFFRLRGLVDSQDASAVHLISMDELTVPFKAGHLGHCDLAYGLGQVGITSPLPHVRPLRDKHDSVVDDNLVAGILELEGVRFRRCSRVECVDAILHCCHTHIHIWESVHFLVEVMPPHADEAVSEGPASQETGNLARSIKLFIRPREEPGHVQELIPGQVVYVEFVTILSLEGRDLLRVIRQVVAVVQQFHVPVVLGGVELALVLVAPQVSGVDIVHLQVFPDLIPATGGDILEWFQVGREIASVDGPEGEDIELARPGREVQVLDLELLGEGVSYDLEVDVHLLHELIVEGRQRLFLSARLDRKHDGRRLFHRQRSPILRNLASFLLYLNGDDLLHFLLDDDFLLNDDGLNYGDGFAFNLFFHNHGLDHFLDDRFRSWLSARGKSQHHCRHHSQGQHEPEFVFHLLSSCGSETLLFSDDMLSGLYCLDELIIVSPPPYLDKS